MDAIHTPVLLEETIQLLAPRKEDEFMVDATLGEGGHSAAFLERFPTLRIAGVDADGEIQCKARERLCRFRDRMHFFIRWAEDFFNDYPPELPAPDTILFDLGISLYHYEQSKKGFSFMRDEFLDMRLDPACGKTAAELIANLSEKELADMIYANAEERYSRRIAAAVQKAKKQGPLISTAVLARVVSASVPAVYRRGPIHPATRTFQALRMAVNSEAEKLPVMLERALDKLKNGGRMGVISFHSGEDRKVKSFFREKRRDCTCPPETPICRCGGVRTVSLLTRKPVTAGKEECRKNPPSRSAKFRAVEKMYAGVNI
ncbi:MAG: 16S rRNA (cytosine(1402)-N(4))-methyltransferase RsmH [Treponema sp.]|jgi:16S rRNA (cytosine1402-N4)-methyltransferase|nr:16S rRNA (cytosine(1402)-N(4))-methyltransferase RsmH [Treponema sp.]